MYIHVPLTILLMIVTLCMLLFSLKQNKSMQQTFMDNRQKIAGVNASLQDTLAGIRVVKSLQMKILKDINLQEVMRDFYKVRKIIIIVWENSKVVIISFRDFICYDFSCWGILYC